jgi:hypothetical protein
MDVSVFFSWQSDTPADRGRGPLELAVTEAALAVTRDESIPFRLSLDQDTRGVPGSPAVVAAILAKIDSCSVFLADVSLTFARPDATRRAPNPNVLLELGYALRRLGPERVLLVLDSATGTPEQLPFDLRGNRVISYGAAAGGESSLAAQLEHSIRLILTTAGPPHDVAPPVHLSLDFSKERIESERHDYRLHVRVTNRSSKVLKDWSADLRFPSAMLNPQRSYPIVQQPSNDGRVTIRIDERNHSGPVFPDETKEVLAVDYIMNDALYSNRGKLFPMKVEARFFAANDMVASAVREVRDLQWF